MNSWNRLGILVVAVILYCIECHGQSFTEVAQQLGVTEVFGHGAHGGGISLVDFNEDGWNDLTLGTEAGREILFYINQNGLSFQRVDLGIPDVSHQKQILWVDYDNDDDLDFYHTGYNGINHLYENIGGMVFEDVTVEVGLPVDVEDSYGAVFGDVNNDGNLDLFISNYFFSASRFFIFESGEYIENTNEVITLPDSSSLNFCAAFFDHERDNDLDLYVINDKIYENDFYMNEGNLNFVEKSAETNTDIIIDAMNAGIGDINNDGLLDIYVTDSPETGNTLLRNNPDGTYTDISISAGVTFGSWCWGGSIGDINNDGFQDIYVCSAIGNGNNQNELYINQGDETFVTLQAAAMPGDTTQSNCNSIGDYNNDGLIDIFVSATGQDPYFIWKNETSTTHNYFKVKLEGSISNRNGVGSWIELYADTLTLFRFTHCGIAYLSQESYINHFGVNDFTAIDSLIVRWPSGIVDKLYNLNVNQTIHVVEDCPSCPTCEGGNVELDSNPLQNGNYHYTNITSKGVVSTYGNVLFRAMESVNIQEEFEVQNGGVFRAEQRDCIEN